MKTDFPDPSNVLIFNLTITPDEGESGFGLESGYPSEYGYGDRALGCSQFLWPTHMMRSILSRSWRGEGGISARRDKHKAYECKLTQLLGIYKGGQFHFTFNIGPNYPHEPPKVLCTQKVRHVTVFPHLKGDSANELC